MWPKLSDTERGRLGVVELGCRRTTPAADTTAQVQVASVMDSEERRVRGEAFKASVAAGRLSAEKIPQLMAGWIRCGFASAADADEIMRIALATS